MIRLALVMAVLVGALALLQTWRTGEGRRDRAPERVEGRARVVDGDTLRVDGVPVRLAGLDAPELAQSCARADGAPYPCGEAAREALRRLIDDRSVACDVRGRDRYRRLLARCRVDGEDLGRRLVRDGLAVAYRGYEAEEREARARRRGLWAGTFQPPEAWRRERRERSAEARGPRILPALPALP